MQSKACKPSSLDKSLQAEIPRQLIEGNTGGARDNVEFDYMDLYYSFKGSGGMATMANNGYTKNMAESAQEKIDLICFGRPSISNPDLVEKLKNNLPLTTGDQKTFYGGGERGYIDYQIVDTNVDNRIF